MHAVRPWILPPVQFDSVTSTQELLISSLLLKSLCFFPKGSIRVLFLFPFENTALKYSLSWYSTLLWSYYMCNQQGYTYPTISWSTCGQLSPQSLLFLASPCLFGESYHCSENSLSIKYFPFENDAQMAPFPVLACMQNGVQVESRLSLSQNLSHRPWVWVATAPDQSNATY